MESALAIGGIKKDTAVIKTDIAMAYQIQGFSVTSFLKNDKWLFGILKTLSNWAKIRVKNAKLLISFGVSFNIKCE